MADERRPPSGTTSDLCSDLSIGAQKVEHGGFKHELELTANFCSGLLAGFELGFFYLLSQSNVNVSRRSLIMLSWGGGGKGGERSGGKEKKQGADEDWTPESP